MGAVDVEAVLAQTNWHQGNAAKILGISSKTLYRKIREYGLRRPRPGREDSTASHQTRAANGKEGPPTPPHDMPVVLTKV